MWVCMLLFLSLYPWPPQSTPFRDLAFCVSKFFSFIVIVIIIFRVKSFAVFCCWCYYWCAKDSRITHSLFSFFWAVERKGKRARIHAEKLNWYSFFNGIYHVFQANRITIGNQETNSYNEKGILPALTKRISSKSNLKKKGKRNLKWILISIAIRLTEPSIGAFHSSHWQWTQSVCVCVCVSTNFIRNDHFYCYISLSSFFRL